MKRGHWQKCSKPEELLSAVGTLVRSRTSRQRAIKRRKLELFALACCHRIPTQIADRRIKSAFKLAEREIDLRERDTNSSDLQGGIDQALAALPDGQFTGDPEQMVALSVTWTVLLIANETKGYRQLDLASEIAGMAASATGQRDGERVIQANIIRDIFGNPFRPVTFNPDWRTSTAVALARQMYDSRDFSAMPILADALQDAGCESPDILDHCRGPGPHVKGCWVVDLVLGKE